MEEPRDMWEAGNDDFQAAWEAETGDHEVPPAPVHYGPGFPEDERLDCRPDFAAADVVELGRGDAGRGRVRRRTTARTRD